MTLADAAKIAALVLAAVVVQTSVVSSLTVGGGSPDLLLVTLVGIGLLRGAVTGAAAGFAAGLLVDTAALGTLGVTSLVLTVAGYWIGRYGETTGRDRMHAPVLATFVVTVLTTAGAFALHFLLGDALPLRFVFVDALMPALLFNVLLVVPAYALCRRLLPPVPRVARAREVILLG